MLITTVRAPGDFRLMQELTEREHLMFHSQPKKHIVTASGVVAGGVDDYNVNSYYVFCDLDTLKQIMKKEFKGRVIPGQPSTKSGKAYKEFYYSSAQVKVDDMSNVNDVAKQIRDAI